jgi:hypothetical protein
MDEFCALLLNRSAACVYEYADTWEQNFLHSEVAYIRTTAYTGIAASTCTNCMKPSAMEHSGAEDQHI